MARHNYSIMAWFAFSTIILCTCINFKDLWWEWSQQGHPCPLQLVGQVSFVFKQFKSAYRIYCRTFRIILKTLMHFTIRYGVCSCPSPLILQGSICVEKEDQVAFDHILGTHFRNYTKSLFTSRPVFL